ncbi:TVP38/TMEM64 family protein [Aliiglaciecola litoralis]|uniref:TVP38/TMEM64 family membrane protein n=1 Tax=Aliiglaciecola litoralis TaxID=582857 RepID=A0ABN1LEL4_9ALTE
MKERNQEILKMTGLFLVIALAVIFLWKVAIKKEQIIEAVEYIQSFGGWSIAIYALLYITLVSLSFPSSVFNIGAGILFSFTQAAILASLCGLTAASVTFVISRYFFRDFFCTKMEASEKGKKVLKLVESESGKVIVLLRLNTFLPAVVKNYGLGASDVAYTPYALYTLIGQLPLTLMYVYIGWIGGRSILAEESGPDTAHWVMLGLGLTITIITLAVSHYYFRNKMQRL